MHFFTPKCNVMNYSKQFMLLQLKEVGSDSLSFLAWISTPKVSEKAHRKMHIAKI